MPTKLDLGGVTRFPHRCRGLATMHGLAEIGLPAIARRVGSLVLRDPRAREPHLIAMATMVAVQTAAARVTLPARAVPI
jgi:hypothetical protein